MTVRFVSLPPAASTDQISALEASLGMRLPDRFREFLARQNGGDPESNMRFFDRDGERIDVSVNRFFGVDAEYENLDLAVAARRMCDRLPTGFIPVAAAPCGDVICLGLDGAARGSVWFWEHEFAAEADEEPDFRNMTFLATDFDELLELLQPFDLDAWLRDNSVT